MGYLEDPESGCLEDSGPDCLEDPDVGIGWRTQNRGVRRTQGGGCLED